MSAHVRGSLYALFSGLFFGLIGYFGISVLRSDVSVYNMLFWRFLVSMLFVVLILQNRHYKSTFRDWSALRQVIYHGIFFYGTCSILYFLAAESIGSGLAMVIFFTYPAFVLLFNLATHHQKFNWVYVISIGIIFCGMYYLGYTQEAHFNWYGVILSLLSAVLFAAYLLMSKKSQVPALLSTFFLSLGCVITSLIAALIDHSFFFPTNIHIWLNIFGIGIICTSLPLVLLLKGLRYINATLAAILSVLEPVFVVLFGVTLLGEHISPPQITGITLILAGSFGALIAAT